MFLLSNAFVTLIQHVIHIRQKKNNMGTLGPFPVTHIKVSKYVTKMSTKTDKRILKLIKSALVSESSKSFILSCMKLRLSQ